MTSYSDLQDACSELGALLDELDANEIRNGKAAAGLVTVDNLLADADRVIKLRRTPPTSRPPWNPSVANALLDAHELIRRIEASLRQQVTRRPGLRRGGSSDSTKRALESIPKLAEAATEYDRKQAARELTRAAVHIEQLASIDSAPKWERIRPGPGGIPPRCPRCLTFSLRVSLLAGVVKCVFPGENNQGCRDLDGNPMLGRLELNRLDGSPVLQWRDGTVSAAPGADRQVFAELDGRAGEAG